MSSSDTDEELNVSQYDVEDDLNAYRSPVHTTEAAVNALPVCQRRFIFMFCNVL